MLNKHDPKNDSVNDAPYIKDFSDHFKSLNDGICIDENKKAQLKLTASNSSTNDVLDCPITDDEIRKCIDTLKNNKATGDDQILNEYIKSTADIMIKTYTKLFNVILDTGVIPESWSKGVILPLFKKKGSGFNVDNYCGITILSCL